MILVTRVIDIQSKAEFLVERFRSIDIGNGDDYHFKFHVHDACSFSWFYSWSRLVSDTKVTLQALLPKLKQSPDNNIWR
jgi:hypothetical protein